VAFEGQTVPIVIALAFLLVCSGKSTTGKAITSRLFDDSVLFPHYRYVFHVVSFIGYYLALYAYLVG